MRVSLAIIACWLGLVFGAQPPHTDKQGYANTGACLVCHEEMGKAFLKTRHGSLENNVSRGWKGQSCESCHGPGAKHGEAAEAKFILNHAKATPRVADSSCLSCHRNQATHVGRVSGSHARMQVACVSCHSVHHEGPGKSAAVINALCSNCHASAWAAFQRSHAHALPQGVMSCVDCHNPHGTSRSSALRSTARTTNAEPGCFNCHADKRGPFAFEHAPVRLEGCAACHEPHGSANPRMLNRAEVLNLCLECHANAPGGRAATLGTVATGFHDLRLPAYRNCTSCHAKIHGSHINRDFLR
ncbi:MAG: DmsE family decaheme c-type cytochrome [Bryobacteraceae bacterium]|nr:DmsE family decaheme c-type cytochrome [Bryobacteraceae bacterium]